MNQKQKNRPLTRQERQRQQEETDSISLVTFFLVIAIIGVSISIVIRSFFPGQNTVTTVETVTVEQDVVPASTPIPDTNSAPIITDVILREEWTDDDKLVIYQDIYFTDADGDVAQADFTLVETTAQNVYVNDGVVSERPEAQREGAIHIGTWTCHNGSHTVTLSVELVDQNENRSNAETFTITCRN